jgi:dTDP-4-dehydrorhamnose 3,5-epimerase
LRVSATPLDGVFVADTAAVADHRGTFCRLFCGQDLAVAIGGRQIRQINYSRTSAAGAVRGLHFQHPPASEMKLVRCLKGRVWDVAVDLRAGSATFLQWHGEELSAQNARMVIIPEGCAHGFQVLEPESELLYLHTAPYSPEFEDGVSYDDSRLAIAWPIAVSDVSLRDTNHAAISPGFTGITV